MRRRFIEIIEADFVVYEGKGPACDFATGQYATYPRLVKKWCALTGAYLRPAYCVRYYFLKLYLPLSELEILDREEQLSRVPAASEIVDRSGCYYVDCVPLTAQQACWGSDQPRGLLVPRARISYSSDEVLVQNGRRQALIGSDGNVYVIDPKRDTVWSKREPRPKEFRTVA